MDTTQNASASTIAGFLQSEEENGATSKSETRSQREQVPRRQEQEHRFPPPLPPPGYYPYYPPLPPAPSMSYVYMDILRHLSLQSELRSYLAKYGESNEKNSQDSQVKKNNSLQIDSQEKACDNSRHKNGPYGVCSHLCLSCEQHLRCSCCSKLLITERAALVTNKPSCNYCQCLLPLQSLMHFQHNPIQSCNCSCQNQMESKSNRKSKQKYNKNKCQQTYLQSDCDEIPEKDDPHHPMKNRGKTFKNAYHKDETCESSDSDETFSQPESIREDYKSDYKPDEEQRLGYYVGEGDENKVNSNIKKSKATNRIRRTRRSLAYFINV